MAADERKEIVKKHETRTKEISKMIGEGGLGADKYYKIKKDAPEEEIIQGDEEIITDKEK